MWHPPAYCIELGARWFTDPHSLVPSSLDINRLLLFRGRREGEMAPLLQRDKLTSAMPWGNADGFILYCLMTSKFSLSWVVQLPNLGVRFCVLHGFLFRLRLWGLKLQSRHAHPRTARPRNACSCNLLFPYFEMWPLVGWTVNDDQPNSETGLSHSLHPVLMWDLRQMAWTRADFVNNIKNCWKHFWNVIILVIFTDSVILLPVSTCKCRIFWHRNVWNFVSQEITSYMPFESYFSRYRSGS
jgi:hypothetical protein